MMEDAAAAAHAGNQPCWYHSGGGCDAQRTDLWLHQHFWAGGDSATGKWQIPNTPLDKIRKRKHMVILIFLEIEFNFQKIEMGNYFLAGDGISNGRKTWSLEKELRV